MAHIIHSKNKHHNVYHIVIQITSKRNTQNSDKGVKSLVKSNFKIVSLKFLFKNCNAGARSIIKREGIPYIWCSKTKRLLAKSESFLKGLDKNNCSLDLKVLDGV